MVEKIETVLGSERDKLKPFIGRTITGVWRGSGDVAFTFDDGTTIYCAPEGDCCSHSWVEHVSGVADAIGATVDSVDVNPEIATHDDANHEAYDVLALYGISLITTRGHRIDIDYRNESNGYYGGWLNWHFEDDVPDGHWVPMREDF
jgi:hypothetical protein